MWRGSVILLFWRQVVAQSVIDGRPVVALVAEALERYLVLQEIK